jgi:hypothetical protein
MIERDAAPEDVYEVLTRAAAWPQDGLRPLASRRRRPHRRTALAPCRATHGVIVVTLFRGDE